jgi:hypothetical protein
MVQTSLYGFSPTLEPFAGKSPAEQVALLRSWGNTVVFGGYQDPAFVDAAHEAGLPVYAEFGCFTGERWWVEVPASRPVTEDGQLLAADGWYYGVNPSVAEVRQAQLSALETLLTNHSLDGVWLDFIRWPCHWEVPDPYLPHTSFDRGTLERFCQDTGIEVPRDDVPAAARELLGRYETEWTAWRCRQITEWVAQARAVVERVRPGASLGLFGVPWRLADRAGAILHTIGQDYRALGQYVDVFSPMVYHKMCGHQPTWIAEVTEEVYALTGKPVWPIIQSVGEPIPISLEEYGQALDVALNCPSAAGVLVFHMQGALEPAKLAVTTASFNRPNVAKHLARRDVDQIV